MLIAGAVLLAVSMSALVCLKNRNRADDLFSANVEAQATSEGFGRICVPNAGLGSTPYTLCSTCRMGRTTIYSYSFCNN